MDKQSFAGPSGNASWEDWPVGAGTTRPLRLLVLPDAANSLRATAGLPAIYYYLPKIPRLARDTAGMPVFSLVLVLNRQPNPGDETISPLIEQGILAFELTLAVPAEALADPLRVGAAEYQPLFAREVLFSLTVDDGTMPPFLARAAGANARAGFSTSLGRSATLGVLSALHGGASNITMKCKVTYRTAATDQAIHLTGSWAAIHDFLSAHLGPGGEVSQCWS